MSVILRNIQPKFMRATIGTYSLYTKAKYRIEKTYSVNLATDAIQSHYTLPNSLLRNGVLYLESSKWSLIHESDRT